MNEVDFKLRELYVFLGPFKGFEREFASLERGLWRTVTMPPLSPEEVERVEALETIQVA